MEGAGWDYALGKLITKTFCIELANFTWWGSWVIICQIFLAEITWNGSSYKVAVGNC